MKRTLEEVIRKAIEYKQASLRVALPGRVVSYNATTQTAEVQPMIDSAIALEDGVLEETFEPIPDVPVQFSSGGGFYVAMPVAAGDTGLLVFTDFSMDYWRASGLQASPQDMRIHSAGSAVFIPGLNDSLHPLLAASATDLVIGKGATALITVKPDGSIAIGAAAAAACARSGDAVKVTVPIGTFLVGATAPVFNTVPIDLVGTITAGSAKVKVA